MNFIFICLSVFYINTAQQDTISFKNKFLIGAAAGAATTTILEPLIYIKNRWQQNKPLYLKKCFRGLPVNAAGFILTMAVQNSVFGEVENTLNQTNLTTLYKKVIAALVAGSASAITSCPREILIIQQQNNGGNFYEVYKNLIQQHGIMASWKAGTLVAARNSSFAGCFFIMTPALSDKLGTAAPVVAGALSAIMTHPLDTMKTRLQADPYKTIKQVAQEIYHETHPKAYFKSGLASFFRGIHPRIAGVAATMTLEYRFREYFMQLYKDKLSNTSLQQ
ncbi:MAG TPA: MC/SLC25 family protein [Candidatus Saccharimonadales bacterium]|nr:MC/SLC25 family protein [Candidatus Saccharimonadales bacterium]